MINKFRVVYKILTGGFVTGTAVDGKRIVFYGIGRNTGVTTLFASLALIQLAHLTINDLHEQMVNNGDARLANKLLKVWDELALEAKRNPTANPLDIVGGFADEL